MYQTLLLTIAYLLNYNINVINSKMDLIKKTIVKPEYNFTQKLKLGRELSKLKKDRYIAIITEDLE
jgi:hypothetical protein